jgi:hypothetical protein
MHTNRDQAIPNNTKPLFENRITFKELCARLPHYSEHTLRGWRRKGLPAKRVMGGKLMFDPQEVALWIERQS